MEDLIREIAGALIRMENDLDNSAKDLKLTNQEVRKFFNILNWLWVHISDFPHLANLSIK